MENLHISEQQKAQMILLDHVLSIKNIEIRKICINALSKAPEYFWHIPSSSTGKYHPEDEICDGGLVIHTIKDIIVAKETASMIDLSDDGLDKCVCALILHDTCKNGYPENTGYTKHEHPLLAANLVISTNPSNELAYEIADLIRTHMGRWTESKYSKTILPEPESQLQMFVHMCDMFASRKAWQIDWKGGK